MMNLKLGWNTVYPLFPVHLVDSLCYYGTASIQLWISECKQINDLLCYCLTKSLDVENYSYIVNCLKLSSQLICNVLTEYPLYHSWGSQGRQPFYLSF